MIYVYSLTDPLTAPPAGDLGFEEAPLETLAVERVAAVFSACASSPATDPENLWRHEAVTEALMRDKAVLPARFGTTLTGPERLREVLARNHAAIWAGLDHVRGCVEVGVRILTGDPGAPGTGGEEGPGAGAEGNASPAGGGAGRSYLLCRLAEDRRQRALEEGARSVHLPLARHARDAVQRPGRRPGVLIAAYLVEREHLDGFVTAVREFERESADRQVLCTGPWPPYSFVPTLQLEGSPSA